MKLNPKTCTFEMREGMFLGYKVNAEGLKVCPDNVELVLSLPSPKCLKDMQRLNGKLASLNKFLSTSAKKSLPFFKTLKKYTKKSGFQWTAKAKTAFKQIKKLLAELPMLTAPKEKEEFVIYLAAAKEAISTVLMTKRNGKQMLIYFVSHALQGPKVNYIPMEKLILALMFELEEHDINYRSRTSVNGQIIENFIMEHSEDDPPDTPIEDKEELLDPWILFTDGSSCIDGFRVGIIITNPEGIKLTYSSRFGFDATNNEAEYEALIAGLWIAIQMGVKNLQANVDSRLVANKLNETYIAKEPSMIKYFKKGKTLPVLSKNSPSNKDNPFKDWCEKLCIRQCFAFVKHLQSNGWVEKANMSLDLLEEKREQVAIQEAKSKAMMEKYYNARIHNTSFKLGDLVYQSNEASHADDNSDLSGKDHMRSRKH
nr:reverse transcriptase domain-containing protein [Tanacetum cinerariifolium]